MKNKTKLFFVFFIIIFLTASTQGFCIDGQDIIKLKDAGLSDKSIGLMIREKTAETCAFSVQEIISLKKFGLSDETICMVISKGSFIKDLEPVIYGNEIKSIKFITVKDIIEVKKAGINDTTIRAIINCGSRNKYDEEHERAWDMLKSMGIIIDDRRK